MLTWVFYGLERSLKLNSQPTDQAFKDYLQQHARVQKQHRCYPQIADRPIWPTGLGVMAFLMLKGGLGGEGG